jgi:voltage-gated potassium channel
MFVALVMAGTAGYMLFESYNFLDALYMTVITLASVGYAEIKPLHPSGRIFTIILILSNLTILTYVLTKVSRFLFDGEFRNLYKQLSMENKIRQMNDHVIVCGGGQNGSEAIKELKKSNIPFVVIDKAETSNANDETFFINDDATKDEVLLKAGIKNAKAILITLPNDSENMFVVLTARELNPNITIICRASKDTSVKRLKTAGANNVIMPDKLGGVHMANLVLFPDVKEFIDVMSTYQTHGNRIHSLTPTKRQTMGTLNAWQKSGILVLGVKKPDGEYVINPDSAYIIDLNDRIIVLGNPDQTADIKKVL